MLEESHVLRSPHEPKLIVRNAQAEAIPFRALTLAAIPAFSILSATILCDTSPHAGTKGSTPIAVFDALRRRTAAACKSGPRQFTTLGGS
jgi:hypothetical protein